MNWIRNNRWQILLTIILTILWALIWDLPNFRGEEAKANPVSRDYLEKSYALYNAEYFGNKLPKDTVIDQDQTDPNFMAITTKPFDGKFHIGFNSSYVSAERTGDLTLLHEMCHVKTWGDDHGGKWRACMISLDLHGAFREELIYSFQEKP